MRTYTNDNPEFSDSIQITEVTDPAHADNVNAAPIQAFENTLVLKQGLENSDTTITDIMQMLITGIFYAALTDDDGIILTDDDGRELLADWKFAKA